MIFIFCKNTERFVKITKRYLNHCQQTGFIHPAHPKHNYQAVKPKAGTRLCLHMHDYSHSFQRLHCPVEISALQASQLGLPMWNHLFSPWFVTVLWMLWPFFFVFEYSSSPRVSNKSRPCAQSWLWPDVLRSWCSFCHLRWAWAALNWKCKAGHLMRSFIL